MSQTMPFSYAIISEGNSKVPFPNVNMSPVVSCGANCACKAPKNCYALKAYRAYPGAKAAWDSNYWTAVQDRQNFFSDIISYLSGRKPEFFRWHCSGDILDQDYLDNMVLVAESFPNTKFMAFTKMHDLDYSHRPKNLSIVFSYWPDWGTLREDMPKSFVRIPDQLDARIPQDALECPGSCKECQACWHLKGSVVFNKH